MSRPERTARPGREPLTGQPLFVVRIRVESQIAHASLRGRVDDRPQQGEATTFAVDGVLPCRKRAVAPTAAAPLPNRKSNQLETRQHACREVQFGVGQLSRRILDAGGPDLVG